MKKPEMIQLGAARLTPEQVQVIEQWFSEDFDSVPEQNMLSLQEIQDYLTIDLLENTDLKSISKQVDWICTLISIKQQFKILIPHEQS